MNITYHTCALATHGANMVTPQNRAARVAKPDGPRIDRPSGLNKQRP